MNKPEFSESRTFTSSAYQRLTGSHHRNKVAEDFQLKQVDSATPEHRSTEGKSLLTRLTKTEPAKSRIPDSMREHLMPPQRRNDRNLQVQDPRLSPRSRHPDRCARFTKLMRRHGPLVLLSSVCSLCFAGEMLFRKVVATTMFNYRWSVLTLQSLLTSIFCFLGARCQPYAVRKRARWLLLKEYLIIGILDLLHNILLFVPLGQLPSPLVVLLPSVAAPVGALLRCIPCDTDIPSVPMRWYHFVGTMGLFGGIYLAVFQGMPWKIREGKTVAIVESAVVMALASIPLLASNLYKRTILHDKQLSAVRMNAQASAVSFFVSWLVAPIAFKLQYLGRTDVVLGMDDAPINFSNALKCLFGLNSMELPQDHCDAGGPPMWQLGVYLLLMCVSRYILSRILTTELSGSVAQHILTAATFMGFCFSYSTPYTNLITAPTGLAEPSGPITAVGVLSVLLASCGSILIYWDMDERVEVEDEEAMWYHTEADL